MEELDFESDDFADIIAKDKSYDARAYTLLLDVIHYLAGESGDKHCSGEEILDEFKERTLDLFGPLSYTVLSEWGLSRTEDIGEMMFNLVDARRIGKDDNDSADSFAGGYDFRETFMGPYQT